jgi:hypothetical protein
MAASNLYLTFKILKFHEGEDPWFKPDPQARIGPGSPSNGRFVTFVIRYICWYHVTDQSPLLFWVSVRQLRCYDHPLLQRSLTSGYEITFLELNDIWFLQSHFKIKIIFNSLSFYIYAVLKADLFEWYSIWVENTFSASACCEVQSRLRNTDLKLNEIFCSIFRQFLIPYESAQIITCTVSCECNSCSTKA